MNELEVNKMPLKAKEAIEDTKNILDEYGVTFEEYMANHCHRKVFQLGSIIDTTFGEKGIVCGWNGDVIMTSISLMMIEFGMYIQLILLNLIAKRWEL